MVNENKKNCKENDVDDDNEDIDRWEVSDIAMAIAMPASLFPH